jgi:hypothetical protein
MDGLTVNVTGAMLIAKLFHRTSAHLEDPRPAFRSVEDYLQQVEMRKFATGAGWPRLAPSTIRQKHSARILIATGTLMRQLTRKGGKRLITRQSLTFGPTVFYARFVSKRRPLNELSFRNRREIRSIIRRYVRSGA